MRVIVQWEITFATAAIPIFGGLKAEEISALQTLLLEADCEPGPVDGLWGGKTEKALDHLLFGSGLRAERPITPDDISRLLGAHLRCEPIPEDPVYVRGPYRGTMSVLASRDSIDFGCPECNSLMRLLALPDLNRDGSPEVVLALQAISKAGQPIDTATDILVLNSDGSSYAGLRDIPKRIWAREAIVSDFNGDNIGDVFIAAHGRDSHPFPGEMNVLILSMPNGEHFDASESNLPSLKLMSHGAGAGDIDGDGDLDLAVVTNANGGRDRLPNYFLMNDGQGKFSLSRGHNHLPAGSARRVNGFLTARLADMDGDNNLDLIYAGHGGAGQQSLLMLGNGKGKFGEPKILPAPDWQSKLPNTTDIDALDIDGDGDKDLVILHTGYFSGKPFMGMYIQVLMNEGLNFKDETRFRIWNQNWVSNQEFFIAMNINFADLDGDDDLDFVVDTLSPIYEVEPGDRPAQIGINRGSGIFDPMDSGNLASRRGQNGHSLLPSIRLINGTVPIYGLNWRPEGMRQVVRYD